MPQCVLSGLGKAACWAWISASLCAIADDGGEARRAAEVATGVEAFRWCADGQRLVFVSWVWPHLSVTASRPT